MCHFIAGHHIPNFDELVEFIMNCGAEDLKRFLERAATYTSKIAVVEFIEADGLWAKTCLLKHVHQAFNFSIMADEYTDVTITEELSVFCLFAEDGQPC